MQLNFGSTTISYIDNNIVSDECIIFIHGWGQNKDMMKPLADNFKSIRTICIDLPGFGESKLGSVISVYDYASILNKFISKLKIKNPTLVGHSFGGKISLVYASKYHVNNLVVLAAPFKKTKSSSFQTKLSKLKEKVNNKFLVETYIKLFGSTDYKNSSIELREVLKSSVTTGIEEDIKKINCPTLLIWGVNDDKVPLSDAYEIKNMIYDSAVIKIENGSHYAYLEAKEYVHSVLKEFIKKE